MNQTEEAIEVDTTEPNPRILHGVHFACQEGAPFLITQCGLAADDEEWTAERPDHLKCEECWTPAPCRVCGIWLA